MSMPESMSKLCLSDKFADVTFVFGSEKLSAHRVVLSMRSPVFEAMLYGLLSETPGCEIRIEDTDPETFRQFLWFIYTDDISLDGDSVLKIQYLANKYNLDILEDKCSAFLQTSIDVENVCLIYEPVGKFGHYELQRSCFKFITENAEGVLCSDSFLNISKESLGTIISSDDLSIDEKSVFDAAIRWAKQQCKDSTEPEDGPSIRHQLGNVLYSIRLPLIPMDVFAKEICQSQVLTTEEENLLFRYFATTGDTETQPQALVGDFLAKSRTIKYVHVKLEDMESQARSMALHEPQNVKLRRKTTNLNPVQIKVTHMNRKNMKLHSIKCSKQCSVSTIQRVHTCTAPSGESYRPVEVREPRPRDNDDYSSDETEEEAEIYTGRNDLHINLDQEANIAVLQPPLVVETGTIIKVCFTQSVRARSYKSVTRFTENGLDLQISSHKSLFDELIFLRYYN